MKKGFQILVVLLLIINIVATIVGIVMMHNSVTVKQSETTVSISVPAPTEMVYRIGGFGYPWMKG